MPESEHEAMSKLIESLKSALAGAIVDTSRVQSRCIDFDPEAGSTYEIDWKDNVKEWAKLCGLNLNQMCMEYFLK